jgi:methylmalonyl-CoA/ethylmalonyl-CoA epimerase
VTATPASLGPVHHVGFVVRTIGPTETVFGALGYQRVGDSVEDDRQDAEIVFLARNGVRGGEPLIELIAPRSEASPVAAFARESRFRIHHLCFAVEDMDAALLSMLSRRITLVTPVVEAPAIGGRRIVFLFSRETGLFELVEQPPF